MNINIYHWKQFAGFLSSLPLKPSITTLCFMHMQEKNRRSEAQGPCWCYGAASLRRGREEPRCSRGALHNLPASPAAATPLQRRASLPTQGGPWQKYPPPTKEQEGWSSDPPQAPCHDGCVSTQKATLKQSSTGPQHRTPRWVSPTLLLRKCHGFSTALAFRHVVICYFSGGLGCIC